MSGSAAPPPDPVAAAAVVDALIDGVVATIRNEGVRAVLTQILQQKIDLSAASQAAEENRMLRKHLGDAAAQLGKFTEMFRALEEERDNLRAQLSGAARPAARAATSPRSSPERRGRSSPRQRSRSPVRSSSQEA